jgi:AcrR family transcriptional regulator
VPRRKTISDEAVLEGALKVMFRTGPEEFTLRAVSDEVGVSPATLLQRFGDKHGLIVRALSHDNADFAELIGRAPRGPGREAVLDLFWLMTPDAADAEALATGLLWLREDFRDPGLNALARERFVLLRAAIAARLPPLPLPAQTCAVLLEAQWQGAINQWGFFRQGTLPDHVSAALNAWFDLAEAGLDRP